MKPVHGYLEKLSGIANLRDTDVLVHG